MVSKSPDIKIKRIYEEPTKEDGYRILVDRLWPRGVKKEKALLDEWNKNIAPSTDLRKWFAHEAANFEEFSALYRTELEKELAEIQRIRKIAESKPVSLLYAAKDPRINHARVLCEVLKEIYDKKKL